MRRTVPGISPAATIPHRTALSAAIPRRAGSPAAGLFCLALLCALALTAPGAARAAAAPTVQELFRKADLVLDVTMHRAGVVRDPHTGNISTDWQMQVHDVLYARRGQAARSIAWRTAGGCIGDRCQTITGWPFFNDGERAVAFLTLVPGDSLRVATVDADLGWFAADSAASPVGAVWTQDAQGAWTVRWGADRPTGWTVRRTVWAADPSGARRERHDVALPELAQQVRDMARDRVVARQPRSTAP